MEIDKENIKSAIFFIPLILLVAIGINSLIEDKKEDKKIIEIKENNFLQKEKPKEIIKERIITKTITKYVEKKDVKEEPKELM